MTRIALLAHESDEIQDSNYLRLANAALAREIPVTLCFMEGIGMSAGRVWANGFGLNAAITPGEPFPACQRVFLDEFDVVWVLSLGMRQSFLDKMQILFTLPRTTRVVNSLDALMHFKSKYFTASHGDVWQHPQTWASCDPGELYAVIEREGGRFVAKPPAASFGRDVFVIDADDPNRHVILESLCGPDADRYCLLQRYVPEVRHGEKRVLIAGGRVVGQYLRVATRDHRTNVLQGSRAEACTLTRDELEYCNRIGARLLQYGAQFVGMDFCNPWVIEFNVVNPGGITTIAELTGEDLAPAVLQNVLNLPG